MDLKTYTAMKFNTSYKRSCPLFFSCLVASLFSTVYAHSYEDDHRPSRHPPDGIINQPHFHQIRAQDNVSVNVLDDLCRLHSDQLSTSDQLLQHQWDRIEGTPTIDVFHDKFDPSFGLVPHVSYTVRVEGWRRRRDNNCYYALLISWGNVASLNHLRQQSCISNETGHGITSQAIILSNTTSLSNLTWISNETPEVPVTVFFRFVRYSLDLRETMVLASANHTLLTGCFLKLLHSTHGIVSNSHIESNPDQSTPAGCTFLLRVPAGSSAEFVLRKLKLPRSPHSHDCYNDYQLQLASLSARVGKPQWHILEDPNKWSIGRNFCGKVQDYAKTAKVWHTFDPWVMIRFVNGPRFGLSNSPIGSKNVGFFSLRFVIQSPCSNLLLTDHSKSMELSDWDFSSITPECTFRVHLPYGYKVQLRVILWDERMGFNTTQILAPNEAWETNSYDNNRFRERIECLVSVHAEDAAGQKTECLHKHHLSATFHSVSNVLTFQATLLHEMARDRTNVSSAERIKLQVQYTSVADENLVKGCHEGVAADEHTCIWLNPEPMTWEEAEISCGQVAPGGHLVAVTHPVIQQVVEAVITNSPTFEPTKSYWIGGSDLKQETLFQWSSGQPFQFTNWFRGWPMYQDYNAQPSDDGLSNQDCVEIRQNFGQPGQSDVLASGLYWNDRDCSVINPFVCQQPRQIDGPNAIVKNTIMCNRSEELHRYRTSLTLQSPSFPQSYPNGISCIVELRVPPGYKIILNFDQFDLEEEEDCNYDSLEVRELAAEAQDDGSSASWKRCGNWNTRLKLLRFRSNGNRVQIKFSSDTSYGGNGFQLVASMERNDFTCSELGSRSVMHHGRCYLIVPFPEIGWNAASHMCKSMQAELVIPDSGNQELNYLSELLHADEQFNSTPFYWIGQASRFQLSVHRSSESKVDIIRHCPVLQTWPSYSNTSVEPCYSPGGYICERIARNHDNHGATSNTSIESRDGEVKSPNYPAFYGENNYFRLHIKAPNASSNSERLVMRFKHIDIEYQENCLYDYVGLQSREDGPMRKLCGMYTNNLDRFDYISDTSEIWLTFHSDYSISGGGFHAVWSIIRLDGCPHQILRHSNGDIYSPNFPNYVLPELNCTTQLVAPEGNRISIRFHFLEIGFQAVNGRQLPCREEYIRLSLDNTIDPPTVLLCGTYNVTKTTLQWISYGNQLSLQLLSADGKRGRGFHASYRFLSIPTVKNDVVIVDRNEVVDVIPLNFPQPPPFQLRHRMTFITSHGFYLRFKTSIWMRLCEHSVNSSLLLVARFADSYSSKSTEITLCHGYETQPFQLESVFHSLTFEYEPMEDGKRLGIIGNVISIPDGDYMEKLSNWPEELVDTCNPNPCQNDGICVTTDEKHYCKCADDWQGLFCSLTLCQLPSACNHGSCESINGTQRCSCDPGFTGNYCDIRLGPCDLDPCGEKDRGKCVPNGDDFICECRAWYKGPRCEQRWLHLPYKPLSQRMLEEPFWLGLMTIAVVMVLIGVVWCIKRHFAEKIDRFMSEELERGKLVEPALLEWPRGGRPPMQRLSLETNTTSRPASPQHNSKPPETAPQRHLLGWSGFRKPSLLSITSLISPSVSRASGACPAGAVSPGVRGRGEQREGRTFSLDDLFRLHKRSPSPSKRGSDNDVAQQRETERQKILQRLIASQIPGGLFDHESGQAIITTKAKGLLPLNGDELSTDTEPNETVAVSQIQLPLDPKTEKKVTFARMMEMVKADISSSETDTSAGEEIIKSREAAAKRLIADERGGLTKRKHRTWSSRRFWRSSTNNSNSSTQGSASDCEAPDNIFTTEERSPSLELSVMGFGSINSNRKANRHLRLPERTISNAGRQTSSTESLSAIVRNFSVSSHKAPSTPSSPQVSDYELSSSFPTPLSTPGSPAGSMEAISQSSINSDNTTIQVTVIDSSSAQRNNRTTGVNLTTPHITLEIPTISYGQYLSPIHEVPTPLPSPSHTPVPSLKRQNGISDLAVSIESPVGSHSQKLLLPQRHEEENISGENQSGRSPVPSIVIEGLDNDVDEKHSTANVAPATPTETCMQPDSPPLDSPRAALLGRTKPPPLHIINSNFTRFEALDSANGTTKSFDASYSPPPQGALPVVFVSEPSPDSAVEAFGRIKARQETHSRSNSPKHVIKWEQINIGSPPSRKHPVITESSIQEQILESNVRRSLKDTLSNSLDLPNPPPLITITSNFCHSEVESDSDAGTISRGCVLNQSSNMCYLSPFTCYGAVRSDIAASESNLSSSGYSSMASPGPSPSCSSKTLHACILEEDINLYSPRGRMMKKDRHVLHRIVLSPSLESSTPPPDSPQQMNSSFYRMSSRKRPSDSEATDDQTVPEPNEHESTVEYESNDEGVDVFSITEKIACGQLRSAKEVENFISTVYNHQQDDSKEHMRYNLSCVQKSVSLDYKLSGQRRNNLKGDSLDTKLLSVQSSAIQATVLQSLQLPDPKLASWTPENVTGDDAKKSPVSSRSESPLSDAKSAGLGRFSVQFYGKSRNDLPYTDSDGLYDYPSSETVPPASCMARRYARKSDRRRERKASLKPYRTESSGVLDGGMKRSLLDPGNTRGAVSRLAGARRRVRAQNNADLCASSSSNESLTTTSKNSRRRTPRHQFLALRRGSSPICNVILTIEAASSPDNSSPCEAHNEQQATPEPQEIQSFKLPIMRNRHACQTQSGSRGSELKRRQDSGGSKRRDQRNSRGSRRAKLAIDIPNHPREMNCSSSYGTESEFCDSSESLANLAEIEDSTDTPPPGENHHSRLV